MRMDHILKDVCVVAAGLGLQAVIFLFLAG